MLRLPAHRRRVSGGEFPAMRYVNRFDYVNQLDARRRTRQYGWHLLYKTGAVAAGPDIRIKGNIMANFLMALVTAELSLFGVDATAPVLALAANAPPPEPRFLPSKLLK